MTIKIGLIQGNGKDLVGGGSIQLEYNLWAGSQNDIELTNFVAVPNDKKTNFYTKKEISGRTLKNVVEFNNSSPNTIFDNMDKLIVLTYPFADSLENKEETANWYKNTLKQFKSNNDKWLGVICYDYKKEVVLNNLGALYVELYEMADKIWVNNERNPLVSYLYENSKVIESQFHFTCPQFMNETKLEWKAPQDKKLNWLYYQGRALAWKGWNLLPQLSQYLNDYHLIFNGVDTVKGDFDSIVTTSYVEATNRINFEDKDRMNFNAMYEKYFVRKEKETSKVELYGFYDPKTANEITSTAGFAMYYTILNPDNNFFPEYALIDAIRNGTVVILPSWYFYPADFEEPADSLSKYTTTKIIDGTPEETGFLIYDYKSNNYLQLLKKLTQLRSNPELYEQYRERAFNYMIKEHGANKKIRDFLK